MDAVRCANRTKKPKHESELVMGCIMQANIKLKIRLDLNTCKYVDCAYKLGLCQEIQI